MYTISKNFKIMALKGQREKTVTFTGIKSILKGINNLFIQPILSQQMLI